MNRKISIGGAVTLAIMFSTVTFIMTMIYAQKTFDSRVFSIKERETMYAKLAEVDRLVRQNYFNTIDEEKLRDELVAGYVRGIGDNYGMYLTAEQYAAAMSSYEGQMVDIGVLPAQDGSGYIRVEEVYADSPAQVAGLQKDDIIVKVDELAVNAQNYEQAVEALQGEPGTNVTLLVRRAGDEQSYSITRRRVDVMTVDYRLIQNVGYVRIQEFNDNTPAQFERAIGRLLDQQVEGLVFDVRNNPGGTIPSVVDILDQLLPEGPIMSAVDKAGNVRLSYQSDARSVDLPMAVLINAKSASAAELFAQALKDYNMAKTVGVTSYGKGSMQEIHKLSDGSALDITVARYNPPFSPNFEGIGVKPDYEVKLTPDQEALLEDLDEYSDPQLKKALEVVGATLRNQGSDQPGVEYVPPPASQSEPVASEPEDGADGETEGEGDGSSSEAEDSAGDEDEQSSGEASE